VTNHSPSLALPALVSILFIPAVASAQRAPEAGYIFPNGGKAGTTIDVKLGGYNWTPDMEYFVSDSRVRLVPSGPPGPILIPEPPYWFGAKGRIAALPLPKEVEAKLVISGDVSPGPIYWQAANANGVTSPIAFIVSATEEIAEDVTNVTRVQLTDQPVTVCGRLMKNEEIDRCCFVASKDGPVTCDLAARRLGSKFLGILEVREANGPVVADVAGSHSADPVLTFAAKAGREYVVSIRDLDFAGDRSFVYRLMLTPGPRIIAALPAAGRRGETREVEFVGVGVASGTRNVESVKRTVTFPERGSVFDYRLDTPWGQSPGFSMPLSDVPEFARPQLVAPLTLPGAVTGVLDQPDAEHRYLCDWKKGEIWSLIANAKRVGSPLDVSLAVFGPDGKELARGDDRQTTTDPSLDFTVPADGTYQIAVSDTAGKSGSRTSIYHLQVNRPEPDFDLYWNAPRTNVPLGGKGDVIVKAIRKGGFKGSISLTLRGLPEGIVEPTDLAIPAGKNEVVVSFKAAADAGTGASLVTLEGAATIEDVVVKRFARSNAAVHLITRDPDENLLPTFVLATTMKPRFKGHPVDKDSGRKVPRGSTFPAEIIVERLDGFAGEITLQMAAQQSYQVQGITGGDVVVPPGALRAIYPCYMPEWLESTRTSRMGIIAVAKALDPKGKERYLVSDIAGFVTMTMEGALLKIATDGNEWTASPGSPFDVRVKLSRSAQLVEPVRIELAAPQGLAARLKMEPVTATAGQDSAVLHIVPTGSLRGVHSFSIRATALQEAKYPVISETPVVVEFLPSR
jgi:hypothetical protein